MASYRNKGKISSRFAIPKFEDTGWTLDLNPSSSTLTMTDIGRKPESCINEVNSTILEKIVSVYKKCAKEKKCRDGPFTKYNYIEEVVKHEKLIYVILKIVSSNIFLSVRDPNNLRESYAYDVTQNDYLLDSINNEEVPSYILSELGSYGKCQLLYDYHVILKIEKFAIEEYRYPFFSTFLLLKPTYGIIDSLDFTSESKDIEETITLCEDSMDNEETITSYEDSEDNEETITLYDDIKQKMLMNHNESEVLLKMFPHLYLDTDQLASEFIYFQDFYAKPFTSSVLNFSLNLKQEDTLKQKVPFENVDLLNISTTNMLEKRDINHTINKQSSPSIIVNFKAKLQSCLKSRNMNMEVKFQNFLTVVETFYFEFKVNLKDTTSTTDELTVYIKNNILYTYLRRILKENREKEREEDLYCVGSREMLDAYILAIASCTSHKFCKEICIKHKVGSEKETDFFSCEGVRLYNLKDQREISVQNGVTPSIPVQPTHLHNKGTPITTPQSLSHTDFSVPSEFTGDTSATSTEDSELWDGESLPKPLHLFGDKKSPQSISGDKCVESPKKVPFKFSKEDMWTFGSFGMQTEEREKKNKVRV